MVDPVRVWALLDDVAPSPIRRDEVGRPWTEIGIDSLDLVEVAVRCEEDFGVAVSDAALAAIRGPGDLIAFLAGGGSAAGEGGQAVEETTVVA